MWLWLEEKCVGFPSVLVRNKKLFLEFLPGQLEVILAGEGHIAYAFRVQEIAIALAPASCTLTLSVPLPFAFLYPCVTNKDKKEHCCGPHSLSWGRNSHNQSIPLLSSQLLFFQHSETQSLELHCQSTSHWALHKALIVTDCEAWLCPGRASSSTTWTLVLRPPAWLL